MYHGGLILDGDMSAKPGIAILGASGAVGREFLAVLEHRPTAVGTLKLLASARSAGQRARFRGEELVVEQVGLKSFDGVDIALFSAGASASREWAPIAVKAGARVVDNSSAFRMDAGVPLVIPEINPQAIGDARQILRWHRETLDTVSTVKEDATSNIHLFGSIS